MLAEVLTEKTFNDLRIYGIECDKDKYHNKELRLSSQGSSDIIEIYPKWILSAKNPKKQITICKLDNDVSHRIPIIKFQWESRKYDIKENQVGIFMLASEKHGYIPAIIFNIDRSIYDASYVNYLGDIGNTIQNILIDILNY